MTFRNVVAVESTGSTNSDLIRALSDTPDDWPHLSVLVAHAQTEGRGRNGNSWQVPPGRALTCSVVLETDGLDATWAPLAVGLAVSDALAPWAHTRLKWPNDVVLDEPPVTWGFGRKIAGILCELHGTGRVVAGIGVNCLQTPDELPVPWAVSLAGVARTPPTPAEVLDAIGAALGRVWEEWAADPAALRRRYTQRSAVVGREVSVALPGGLTVRGTVSAVDDDGALVLETAGERRRIVAGDVVGLRPPTPDAM